MVCCSCGVCRAGIFCSPITQTCGGLDAHCSNNDDCWLFDANAFCNDDGLCKILHQCSNDTICQTEFSSFCGIPSGEDSGFCGAKGASYVRFAACNCDYLLLTPPYVAANKEAFRIVLIRSAPVIIVAASAVLAALIATALTMVPMLYPARLVCVAQQAIAAKMTRSASKQHIAATQISHVVVAEQRTNTPYHHHHPHPHPTPSPKTHKHSLPLTNPNKKVHSHTTSLFHSSPLACYVKLATWKTGYRVSPLFDSIIAVSFVDFGCVFTGARKIMNALRRLRALKVTALELVAGWRLCCDTSNALCLAYLHILWYSSLTCDGLNAQVFGI